MNIGRCFLLISTHLIKISRNCNKMWHKRLEYIFVIFEWLGWNLISLGTRPPRPFGTSMFMLQKYAPDHFCRQTLSWLIAGFYYPCLGAFWDTRGLKLPWSYQCCLKIANSCLYLNSLLRAFTLVNFHQSDPKIVKSQSLLIFEVCLKTSNFIFINSHERRGKLFS